MNIQTLKGFRDFKGDVARKRDYVKNTLKSVFEKYGFEPLETPVLEYEELLNGKYGEEGDKLMYRFEDNGGRKVAMRYDQTVPTARYVAQYASVLSNPFKRYQMQNVYRADNTQKGRYREFLQCDIDTIGVNSTLSDAEIIAAVADGYKALGFKEIKILLNDRSIFEGLSPISIAIIDKLKKIGEDGVVEELVARNECKTVEEAKNLLQSILDAKMPERLNDVFSKLSEMKIDSNILEYSPTLARGLDYYTGLIFEVEIPQYTVGSVCGGGRYDNLIGMFAGKQIPAVGCAFGFDRTVEAMEELNLFPSELNNSSSKVLVTIFNRELETRSLEISYQLRNKKIPTELWLDPDSKMEKQLKYADSQKIPYVVIIGPEEAEKNIYTLKNLNDRTQEQLPIDELIAKLQQ
ncbi:MAG TPA: histidine--tRNA ligase [Patescibacteria group bacterium]